MANNTNTYEPVCEGVPNILGAVRDWTEAKISAALSGMDSFDPGDLESRIVTLEQALGISREQALEILNGAGGGAGLPAGILLRRRALEEGEQADYSCAVTELRRPKKLADGGAEFWFNLTISHEMSVGLISAGAKEANYGYGNEPFDIFDLSLYRNLAIRSSRVRFVSQTSQEGPVAGTTTFVALFDVVGSGGGGEAVARLRGEVTVGAQRDGESWVAYNGYYGELYLDEISGEPFSSFSFQSLSLRLKERFSETETIYAGSMAVIEFSHAPGDLDTLDIDLLIGLNDFYGKHTPYGADSESPYGAHVTVNRWQSGTLTAVIDEDEFVDPYFLKMKAVWEGGTLKLQACDEDASGYGSVLKSFAVDKIVLTGAA